MTVDGKVNLKIPSGTQPNSTLSLENKGVPRLGNPVARGNHQVLVKVKLPTRITEAVSYTHLTLPTILLV